MGLCTRRSKIAARRARTRVWAVEWFFLEVGEGDGSCNKWRGSRGGHKPRRREHPLAAPTRLVRPPCPPSTYSSTLLLHLPPEKNHSTAQTHVLAHFAAFFDLLVQSPNHQTVLGNCSLVCDPSIGPISFYSSALFIAYYCCLGDPVLELCMLILAGPK